MKWGLLIGVFGLSACNEPCDATTTGFSPEDESGPISTDSELVVNIEGTASEATFVVEGPDGPVEGTTSIDGNTIRFTPAEEWPKNATIDWSAEVCGSSAEGMFTTGSLSSTTETDDLKGRSYAVDLTTANWISPPNGSLLIQQFLDAVLLLGVEEVSETELSCLGTVGEATMGGSWQQDPCIPTVAFQEMDFSNNPYGVLEAPVFELSYEGIPIRIYDFKLEGGFTVDAFTDGSLQAVVDTRDYAALYGGEDLCDLISTLVGITCETCASDGEVACVTIEATDIQGERVQGLTVVPNETPSECTPEEEAAL